MVYDPKKLANWQGPTISTGPSATLHQANEARRIQPAVKTQTVQAAQSPSVSQQDLFKQYYDTINGGFGKSDALAKQQASYVANQQRSALNNNLQTATTNRDVGLKTVDSGLAEAKQRTEETAFQKYLASRQSMANKGLSGQGLARDEDVRLQLAHNREITAQERDAANQRYALEQAYNDQSKAINDQLGNIDEGALFNQFYQQFQSQESQQQQQKANQIMSYIQQLRQNEQDEYARQQDKTKNEQWAYEQQTEAQKNERDYMKDLAIERLKQFGQVATEQDAQLLGVPVGTTVWEVSKEQERNKIDWYNADTTRMNANTNQWEAKARNELGWYNAENDSNYKSYLMDKGLTEQQGKTATSGALGQILSNAESKEEAFAFIQSQFQNMVNDGVDVSILLQEIERRYPEPKQQAQDPYNQAMDRAIQAAQRDPRWDTMEPNEQQQLINSFYSQLRVNPQ